MKKFNKKILCFSGTYYSGFESNDLRLVKELKKNFNVIYAVKSNEMLTNYKRNIKIKKNKNIFFKFYNLINSRDKECGFPGFDLKWKKKIIYKKHNTIWINKWSQLFKLIDDCHVVVLGSFRDNLKIIAYARQKNKIVLVHKNPSNFDSEGQILPNIFCVKSEIQKKRIQRQIIFKQTYKINKTDKIPITGSIQYNIIDKSKDEKIRFFKKYNLDINKNLYLFLPAAPQIHDEFYREDYIRVCNLIKKNNNILIKGHPGDYINRKNINIYGKKSSWEVLLPKIKAIDPKDFHKAIQYSKAGVTIFSTVFSELNHFHKPIIFVNRFDHYASKLLKKRVKLSKDLYNKEIKLKKYIFPDKFSKIVGCSNNFFYKNEFVKSAPYLLSGDLKFVGCDLKIESLEGFLNRLNKSKKKYFEFEKKKIGYPEKNIAGELIKYLMSNQNKLKYVNNFNTKFIGDYFKIKKIVLFYKFKSLTKKYLFKNNIK